MPPVRDAGYLLDLAYECGMYETTWQQIQAWMQSTGMQLNPFEVTAIHAISAAYTSAVMEFSGKDAARPYHPAEFDREKVADKVRSALRNRAKK